ncbi:MAG: adenylyl-sulfate reductase [Alphaproteobacteria bacterium]|nr:adenylyl-sulfate reductase [Alphaproteobacteria bacterium]
MQYFIILMVIFVVGGTIFDMIHKKSAKYFFAKAEAAKASRKREIDTGEKLGIAVQTALVDVATSGEFCNPMRRISHLFTMYGFILFLVNTVALVFAYTDNNAPAIVSTLWHVGALMVMFGGYWFWFFIRVDVSAEAKPWYKLARADLFILSLLGTTTFGFLWSVALSSGAGFWSGLFLALLLVSSVVLFGGVIWSKFAHMFFKPAAAYNKRIIKADGSRENLPEIGDLTDPELLKQFPDIAEYLGTNAPNMGLGIKRERPQHY